MYRARTAAHDRPLRQLTQKSYPDSTNVDYVYDLAGKIKQVSDPTGTYSFAYDNMGRLIGTTTQYSFLPGSPFTNAYTYDAASNRKSLTAPDGSITTYDPVGNRLSSSGVPTYNYNSSNELTSTSNGSYTYDANGNTLSEAQGRSYT